MSASVGKHGGGHHQRGVSNDNNMLNKSTGMAALKAQHNQKLIFGNDGIKALSKMINRQKNTQDILEPLKPLDLALDDSIMRVGLDSNIHNSR